MHPSLCPNVSRTELARNRELEVKERSSKHSITMHGTESRSYTRCSPPIGTVRVQKSDQPCSYTVETSGSLLRRNRSALLPYFQQPVSTETNKPANDVDYPELEPASPEPERPKRLELESLKDNAVRTKSGRIMRPPKRLNL